MEGADIAMGLSLGYIGSHQLLTGCRPVLLIRARRVEAATRRLVIYNNERAAMLNAGFLILNKINYSIFTVR